MVKYLRRAEAAERLHVSVSMFKLLVKQGGIRYEVTPGGQKVYDPHEIDRYMAERQGKPIPEGKLVFYVRDSEGNIVRMNTQVERLTVAYGEPVRVYRDRASGLSERRRGLNRLLDDAENRLFDRVAVTARDRLSRFGAAYLERYLNYLGVTLVVLDGEREKGMMDGPVLQTAFGGASTAPVEEGGATFIRGGDVGWRGAMKSPAVFPRWNWPRYVTPPPVWNCLLWNGRRCSGIISTTRGIART